MTSEQFEALVSRLEERARRHPRRYRLRVLLLAMLGYAYLLIFVAAATVVLVAGLLPLWEMWPGGEEPSVEVSFIGWRERTVHRPKSIEDRGLQCPLGVRIAAMAMQHASQFGPECRATLVA